jgi:hypothetical protein
MIVMSQSTACSLRLKKRKGDSNPKGTAVRAPALQDAILHHTRKGRCDPASHKKRRILVRHFKIQQTAKIHQIRQAL